MSFTKSPYLLSNFKTIKVTNLTIYQVVHEEMERLGPGCSLNHIDVSEVTSFNRLFVNYKFIKSPNISLWDTHNVRDMSLMFMKSNFDSDISLWDTFNLKNASQMFYDNKDFSTDISNWDTTNLRDASQMFFGTKKFDCELDKWALPKIKNTAYMFAYSAFGSSLPSWKQKLSNGVKHTNMFYKNNNWSSQRCQEFYDGLIQKNK